MNNYNLTSTCSGPNIQIVHLKSVNYKLVPWCFIVKGELQPNLKCPRAPRSQKALHGMSKQFFNRRHGSPDTEAQSQCCLTYYSSMNFSVLFWELSSLA